MYSPADVVRGEPLQRAWIISKLIAIWFWSHFSLFFSYSWYFNWSIYVWSPSFLYYLRSALTYVGIYLLQLAWNFSGSLPFILVLSWQLVDIVLIMKQCKSIQQCKHQGKKLRKIFKLIWYEDLMLFATLSQTSCKNARINKIIYDIFMSSYEHKNLMKFFSIISYKI